MSNRDVERIYGEDVPKWKVRKARTLKLQGIRDKDIAGLLYLTQAQVDKILRDHKNGR